MTLFIINSMKRFLPVLAFILIAAAAWLYGVNVRVPNPDPNHTHADFAVWIDGKQMDFSDDKYMEKKPTDEESILLGQSSATGSTRSALQVFLHLHDGNGRVIHRHKPDLGFVSFLRSIGFDLTDTCLITDEGKQVCNTEHDQWKLFVNGKVLTPYFQNYMFADGDHILLTNTSDVTEIKRELSLMTDDACLYSKTCPGRGAPPVENCIADPTVPCKIQ